MGHPLTKDGAEQRAVEVLAELGRLGRADPDAGEPPAWMFDPPSADARLERRLARRVRGEGLTGLVHRLRRQRSHDRARREVRQDSPHDLVESDDVRAHHRLPVLGSGVGERPQGCAARGGDEQGRGPPAPPLRRRLDGVVGSPDVHRDRGAASCLGNQSVEPVGPPSGDQHIRPVADRPHRDRPADARRRADHQDPATAPATRQSCRESPGHQVVKIRERQSLGSRRIVAADRRVHTPGTPRPSR